MFTYQRQFAGALEIVIDQNLTLRAPCKATSMTEWWDDSGTQRLGRRGLKVEALIASAAAKPLLWTNTFLSSKFFGLNPAGGELVEFSAEILCVGAEEGLFTFKSSGPIRTQSKLWSDK